MQNENEAYISLLCGHLHGFVYRLRQLKPEHWDYTFAPAAPTPRTLATHAYQWLICDREHIGQKDASQHTHIPEPRDDPKALCDALAVETEEWRKMLAELTPQQFAEARFQFNLPDAEMNIRGFVCHMIQNTIYKHGQFATIYFALGYDGDAPYTAPFPNPIYSECFGSSPIHSDAS